MVGYVSVGFRIQVCGGGINVFIIRIEMVFKAMKLGDITKELMKIEELRTGP